MTSREAAVLTKVQGLLAGLPEHPNEIAEFLALQGCQGKQGSGMDCPLAVYLFNNLGMRRTVITVTVQRTTVCVPDNTAEPGDPPFRTLGVIEHATPVMQFVHGFDDGQYRALIRRPDNKRRL